MRLLHRITRVEMDCSLKKSGQLFSTPSPISYKKNIDKVCYGSCMYYGVLWFSPKNVENAVT